jgi:hypothetical protein
LPAGGFDGGTRTTLVQAGDLLFGGDPIARIERGENASSPLFSFNDLGLFGKIATAPDRALAGIDLLVLLRDGPVGVRFVLQAGIAGTIAGVAAVDFEIVGSEGDRDARILARPH